MDGFVERVLALVGAIPAGRVATYGQLAALAGRPRNARLVGTIMARRTAGLDLPCHRVVRSDGRLSPGEAFGVDGVQRELLRLEGVAFGRDGRVAVEKCRWKGP